MDGRKARGERKWREITNLLDSGKGVTEEVKMVRRGRALSYGEKPIKSKITVNEQDQR